MNIAASESSVKIVAKTCGCSEKRRISYAILHEYHELCLDKRDIISAQLEACERLLKYAADLNDRAALEREIRELEMALGMMT